jgi:hypothetical protein
MATDNNWCLLCRKDIPKDSDGEICCDCHAAIVRMSERLRDGEIVSSEYVAFSERINQRINKSVLLKAAMRDKGIQRDLFQLWSAGTL